MNALAQNHNRLRTVHVTWHSAPGEWQVKEGGSTTVLYRSVTKPPAIEYGRTYGRSIKGELIIHNMDDCRTRKLWQRSLPAARLIKQVGRLRLPHLHMNETRK
jgi:hypothetical protein